MTSISTPFMALTAVLTEQRLSKRFRWAYLLSILALAMAIVLITTLVAIAVTPAREFTIKQPIVVLTKQVKAGHATLLELDYCKSVKDVAIVGSMLARRGLVVPLNVWPSDLPVGCHKVRVLLSIPPYVPPEHYALYLVREYRPSLFGVSGFAAVTEPFEVLPYDGSPAPPPPTALWDDSSGNIAPRDPSALYDRTNRP